MRLTWRLLTGKPVQAGWTSTVSLSSGKFWEDLGQAQKTRLTAELLSTQVAGLGKISVPKAHACRKRQGRMEHLSCLSPTSAHLLRSRSPEFHVQAMQLPLCGFAIPVLKRLVVSHLTFKTRSCDSWSLSLTKARYNSTKTW